MTGWRRVRAWMRARPLVGDSILAALLLVAGFTGQPDPSNTGPGAQTLGAYVTVVLCCLVLVWRRTAPMLVWGATVGIGALGIVVAGGPSQTIAPAMVAIYTVGSLFRKRTAILCAAGTAVTFIATFVAVTGESVLSDVTYTLLAVSGMACAIGIAVRGQRQMIVAAEERAERAEQTRDEEAQRRVAEERLRIARELHDVVAHHISVINVQSGVAKHLVHSDPDAAEVALGHVRDASAVVLSEMSTILGLLRTSDDGPETQPAPGLAQADALVESVRRSGLTVSWRVTGSRRALAPSVDLAAYRIVQEALTNAGKHGTGSVDVTIDYRDDVVVLDVTNPLGPTPASHQAGHGLVGMRERVASVGGTLDASARSDGRFHVHALLPLGSADVASAYERSLA